MPSPAAAYFETVQSIFIAYYQRPADASGLRYWSERLVANGGDVNELINAFANSPESVALYGPINNATIGNVVDSMYLGMFGRLPDAAGKAFYVAGFIAGTFTAGTIALNILDGATGSDAVAIQNKIFASNEFTQIQDGRTYAALDFGLGTVFNATYAGTADAAAARAWLAPVLSSPTTVPSVQQTFTFIKGTIANAGDPITLPAFTITADVASVVEGGTVVFTVAAKNPLVEAGNTYSYSLTGTGLTPGDVVGGLTGTVTLDAAGKGTITVVTINDYALETGETMAVTLIGVPASQQTSAVVSIIDNTTGKVIVLTPAIDVPPATQGTPFDDTFNGNGATLNPGDDMQGAGGYDVFKYASGDPGGPVTQSGFTSGGIEHFQLTADANTTFDMSGTTGLLKVTDTNSRANLTLTNGPAIVDLEMINTTVAHNLTVAYQASTVAGSNTQNLLLNGVLAGSNVSVDGIETMHVTTAGTASTLNSISSNALNTFNLDGSTSLTLNTLTFPGSGSLNSSNSGNLTINDLNFGGSGNVNADNSGSLNLYDVSFGSGNSTIDASGIGGNMYAILSNAGAGGRNVSVTGSANTDQLFVTAGFNSGDSFNGGGGYDYLYADAALSVNTNAITNTEQVQILTGTLGSFDLAMFDTNLQQVYVLTTAGPVVSFLNIDADGSELITIDDYAASLNGKTIRFDSATPGFGLTTVNLEIYDISGNNTVTLQDFDSNGLNPQDPVGTLNLTLWGDQMTVILDPWGSLSTLGLAGDADIKIQAIPPSPTVTLVNGETTTGDVYIDAGVLSNGGATVYLGSGFDTVYAGSGNDFIDIGTGGGDVWGGGGNDTIIGSGAGTNTFSGEDGNDYMAGGNDGDLMSGGNGADELIGNGGEDALYGEGGSDILSGGAENDFLSGGLGADELSGGSGQDTFYYENTLESHGAFTDIITDFVSGSGDLIDVLEAVRAVNPSVTSYDDMVFVGNAPGVAAAQSALSGTGGVEIVYDTLNEQVYIDVDGDGTWTGLDDMVIRMGSPATMQASDFGITQGNTFTAAFAGFDTQNPATSLENTTTSNANDIVNATAAQLPGSIARGLGGFNVFNVRTTITAPTDLSLVMINGDFDRLNLPGGTTAPVIGPDQTRDLDIYIGNGGSIFTTGTNLVAFITQNVNSGSGADFITLTNVDDDANTRAGNDVVFVSNGYYGTVNLGDGADTLDVAAGASVYGATFDGGGDINDVIAAHNNADLSGADISGFDRVVMDGGASTVTMDLADYVALPGAGSIFGPIVAAGYNDTVNLIGGGSALLDDNVRTWTGDSANQTFTLATQSPGFPNPPVPTGNSQIVSTDGGVDEIISNSSQLHGSYNGGGQAGDKFTQNGSSDWTLGTAATFAGFGSGTLTLNNTFIFGTQTVTMSNGQHNSFGNIVGNDGGFPAFGGNIINITDSFSGTTQNTIEVYNLFDPAALQSYYVGGSNQTVNDPNTAQSHVDILNGVANTTLNLTGGGGDLVHAFGSNSGLSINTDGGNDVIDMTFGGGSQTNLSISAGVGDDVITVANGTNVTIDTGTGLDTVSLTNVTGLNLVFGSGLTPDTVNLAGTIVGSIQELSGGAPALQYNLANGTNTDLAHGSIFNYAAISGDTVNFATNGTFTMTDADYDAFSTVVAGSVTGATGLETIKISNTASITAMAENPLIAGNEIENYVLQSAGNDLFTLNLSAVEARTFTLNQGAGGADRTTINNITLEAGDKNNSLIITGFNVADDQIRMQDNGAANGTFQEILTIGSALTVGVDGVFEINTNIGALIGAAGAQDVSAAGAVASLIAGAVGQVVTAGNYFVAAYASDGNAYLYEASITAAADITVANVTGVELLGQLNGVGANTLGLSNFFA